MTTTSITRTVTRRFSHRKVMHDTIVTVSAGAYKNMNFLKQKLSLLVILRKLLAFK